jgi:hypothetical protein
LAEIAMPGDSLKSFVVLFALLAILSFGCIGSQLSDLGGGTSSSGETVAPSMLPAPAQSASASERSGQLVTRESDITIKVPTGTLEAKFNSAKVLLADAGAQTSGLTYSELSDRKEYTLTVKIPPSKFDAVNQQLKSIGEVMGISVNLEDVTKQYNDLDTRINSSQIELDRLYTLYDRSENISDLLLIEQEITRVETDLRLFESEKQDLVSMIDLSTISVTIYEEKPATQQVNPSLEGLGTLFLGALVVAISLIAALAGFLLPLIIVLAVLWLVYKAIRRSPPKSRKPANDQIPPQR